MRRLPRPKISAETLYSASAPVRGQDLMARYELERPRVLRQAKEFETAANADEIEGLKEGRFAPKHLTDKEMKNRYANEVQKKTGRARKYYDALMTSAPHSRCPYCGIGRVTQVDHYLPQARFGGLALVPTNLVPSCADCNSKKLAYAPSDSSLPVLHPYFDRPKDTALVRASLIPGDPPGAVFSVAEPTDDHDERLHARFVQHFEQFDLGRRFGLQAGERLSNLEFRCAELFKQGGASAVRADLNLSYRTAANISPNSWESALYRELADSTWYCEERFA